MPYHNGYYRSTWWDRNGGLVLGIVFILTFVAAITGAIVIDQRGQTQFRKECSQVQGVTRTDDDGDLECYVNNVEIAEYNENSPLHPEDRED